MQQMDQNQRAKLVYRILSGSVSLLSKYYFIHPDIKLLYDAQILYDGVMDELKFCGLITRESANNILIRKGLWLSNGDSNIKEIEKNIDNLKVDLYQARLNKIRQKKIRRYLELAREKLEENFGKKYLLDSYTIESYAESIKNSFIYKNCLVDCNYNRLRMTNKLLNKLVECLNQSCINDTQYRELARTEPWRSYWNAYKSPAVFDLFKEKKQRESSQISFCNFNTEQQYLVSYTKMYDNIYENSDCPDNDIVNDDDVLDGWLILQRRTREQERKKDSIEKSPIMSKHQHAQEIFIPANTSEDIDKINDLNTIQGKIIKKQRENLIKHKGEVKDADFIDKKQEIQMQRHKNYVDKVKGTQNG